MNTCITLTQDYEKSTCILLQACQILYLSLYTKDQCVRPGHVFNVLNLLRYQIYGHFRPGIG